jgi:hypothetical protein
MKTKDVVIGATYLCRIGAELCRVVVVAKTVNHAGRTAYRIRREDDIGRLAEFAGVTWEALPKLRSAAALHTEEQARRNMLGAHGYPDADIPDGSTAADLAKCRHGIGLDAACVKCTNQD